MNSSMTSMIPAALYTWGSAHRNPHNHHTSGGFLTGIDKSAKLPIVQDASGLPLVDFFSDRLQCLTGSADKTIILWIPSLPISIRRLNCWITHQRCQTLRDS